VITGFFAAVGRHRRVILAVGLVLAVVYLSMHFWVPSLGRRAFPVMTAGTAVFILLGIIAVAWNRPNALTVEPRVPAFSAPPQPSFVFIALAFLLIATGIVGTAIRDRGEEPLLPDQLLALSWAIVLLLWVVLAWRGTRVQLRPDGLWQRGITGWLVIPWDALPTVPTLPPSPTARTVRLKYGRPELVRRHGLHVYRHQLHTDEIDPRFLCAAIRYYIAHPEDRPAIGTHAEYESVVPRLLGSLDWSTAHNVTAEHHS
jgi:hypothetical protein